MSDLETMINVHYDAAFNTALAEVERLARLVLGNSKATTFVNGMGMYSFYENDDPVDVMSSSAKAIEDIYQKWDRYLCLSGQPFRLDKSEQQEIVKTLDW